MIVSYGRIRVNYRTERGSQAIVLTLNYDGELERHITQLALVLRHVGKPACSLSKFA